MVIDEVQKLPEILDEVHRLIEAQNLTFLLTGSSARKLKRGGLPSVYPSDDYVEELWAYTALYLKEEIQNEALTRKVAQFSEFLDLMALSNGEEISYQSIAGDCGVSPNSIKNYIQVLEDTLVAFQLKAFTKTRKRKAISRSKLYFFDIGVTNSLAKRGEIMEGSELFGNDRENELNRDLHEILPAVRAHLFKVK